MQCYNTPFSGYSVKFSPFYERRIAVATAQYFGLIGNGRLHILDLSRTASQSPPVTELAFFDTNYGIFDVTWSESHDSLIVAAIGDGSVKLYDLSLPPQSNPLRSLHEHTKRVCSSDWNPTHRDSFLSASWDHTVKLWIPDRPTSVRTFREHAYCVLSVAWNPRHAAIFASASGDLTVRIWDARMSRSARIISTHDSQLRGCDWNKYDDFLLVTAGDGMGGTIKVWDVRNCRAPIGVLGGHRYAARRVKCSPHRRNLIMSCSFDKTVCMWDYTADESLIRRYNHHTEFAIGIDMSELVEGLVASTSWDDMVYAWPYEIDGGAS